MRLTELFTNTNIPWSWAQKSGTAATAEFKISGEPYELVARHVDGIWYISFSALSGEQDDTQYNINGLGSSATVMSTIVDIMRDFLRLYTTATKLQFSAYESSRRSLYAKMINRLLPTWKVEKSEDNAIFTITHPDRVDEARIRKITELFKNSVVPWEWSFNGSEEAVTDFTVGDETYRFYAYSDDTVSWEAEFRSATRRNNGFGLTGTGNAATVMSTIVDIMKDFLKSHPNIETLGFTAKEESRNALYTRMIKRLLPDWTFNKSPDGLHFTLTNPMLSNESQINKSQINELFTNKSVPWEWEQNKFGLAIAHFVVKGQDYIFFASADDYYSEEWKVLFQAAGKGYDGYKITGIGNSAIVMATIVDILREFIKSHSAISTLEFSAEEPSRRSLYTKMVQRLLPTWGLTVGQERGDFILTNPNRIIRDSD
jgi:hypothetical protein